MAGFIGVHVGAGHHSSNLQAKYEQLCKKACRKGVEILLNGGSSLDAVTEATRVLEDSPLTNAGYGSNLTWDGDVECDASVMDGLHLQSGAIGAVSGIKNPVAVARLLCDKQREPLSCGRVQPCLLVGNGAREWASSNGITTVDPSSLISERALKLHHHCKKKLEKYENHIKNIANNTKDRLDTVGAISIDAAGNTAAACSSGGVILKHSGRVGQAAIYGSGCWAEDGNINDLIPSIAVTTSGCGEDIIKTCLAKETARSLQLTNCPTISLHHTLNNIFIKSPHLKNVREKLCGVIGLQKFCDKQGVEFLWAHTTQSLCVGYMSTTHSKPTSRMSRLPEDRSQGSTIIVEGVFC
ncbi:taspase 1 [Lycorma delicatula]|uniref:taspase 1 n=1 Tax=Lycorma delicatula TaxID=130591 RepID=UPI003F50D81C